MNRKHELIKKDSMKSVLYISKHILVPLIIKIQEVSGQGNNNCFGLQPLFVGHIIPVS